MKLTSNIGPTTVSVQSISQTTKIWDLYSASGIKFPYFANVSYGLDPSLNIAMIFLSKGSATELPVGLEEQKIYYIRRFYTNVYVQNSDYYKVYNTLADAQSDQNQLAPSYNPVYPKYFYVNYANKSFNIGECAEFGSDDPLEQLVCCPKPNYFKDIFDTVNFSVHGVDLTLKRAPQYASVPQSSFGFAAGDFSLLGSGAGQNVPLMLYGVETSQPTAVIGTYQFGASPTDPHTLTYSYAAKVDTMNAPFGQTAWTSFGGGSYQGHPGTATSFTMTGSGSATFYGQQFGISFPSSVQVSFDLDSKSTLPPSCKLYMPDAYFYASTRPVTIGTISETLSLDQDSGYYISGKKNYYQIPGRLHIRPKFYPTVESGVRFFRNGINRIELSPGDPLLGNSLQGTTNFQMYMNYSYKDDLIYTYNTNLPQGAIWFDSRDLMVFENRPAPLNPIVPFIVGYSKSVPGPYEGSVTGNGNVYKTQYWGIRSDHPGCYVSSLL